MSKVGTIGTKPKTTQPKTTTNTTKRHEVKELSVSNVATDLREEISNITNKKVYKSLPFISAQYEKSQKDLKAFCYLDDELVKLLEIYNEVYVNRIMIDAIATGKLNTTTEDYLRNEIQVFTNTGAQQQIIILEPEDDLYSRYVEDSKQTGESMIPKVEFK